MNEKLTRFLEKINFTKNIKSFDDAMISKVVVNKSENSMDVTIDFSNVIDIEIIDKLITKAAKGIPGVDKTFIIVNNLNFNDLDVINAFNFILKKIIKKRPSLSNLENNEIIIEEHEIKIEVTSKIEEGLIDLEKDYIESSLKKYGFPNYSASSVLNLEKRDEIKHSIEAEKAELNVQKKDSKNKVIYGDKIGSNITKLDDITDEIKNVVVEGYVFGLDYLEREKISILTMKISDKTNSFICKCRFFQKDEPTYKKIKPLVKENKWYRIKGNVEMDQYQHDLVLFVNAMEEIPSKEMSRIDEAKEKRIELHAHTMMSQMDGVIDVNDLIAQAVKFGHEAIAITDHNALQAFPDAFNNRSKGELKILYGVELNVINDDVDIALNKKDYHLINQEYVVFDTETTGINPNQDVLIEIGAVKIKEGKIIERFDELINPEIKIPPFITNLTNITNEMVKDKETGDKVVKRFKSFIGDLPMVAQNAKFDYGFMKKAYEKYNLGDFDHTILDTMEISRILNPEATRHNLTAITKRFGVDFDEEGHHRADFDAEATAIAFYKMAKVLSDRNIETINHLYEDIDMSKILKFSRPFHITMLVKNQEGLRNLFKIISLANTKYLFKEPKIPRSEIIKHRDGLLIGSSCVNGEVFEAAHNKSEDDLTNIMSFYDYIEVQPPIICEYLIDKGEFKSKLELIETIKKIINVGKKAGKIVVATGDVHNLTPDDLIYREIIIGTRVPSLGFHPLNKANIHEIPNMYYRNTEEMLEDFNFLDEPLRKEIVIKNTHKISDMIDKVEIIKNKLYPPKMENAETIIEDMVYGKAHEIYGNPLPQIIEERLAAELKGIIGGGYGVIYSIAQKLVKNSNDAGYFVGSRGSVGSSLVATMMGITEVNALPPHYVCPECKKSIWADENGHEFIHDYSVAFDMPKKTCECGAEMIRDGHNMPFATFLGFNAEKVPDIDLNFSGENQADAHNFVKTVFGDQNCFRAGTISTVADKTAFGYARGYFESKGIMPRNIEIERLAKGITGVKRTTGQHPGGIIVIPGYMDVYDFTPYAYPADDTSADWFTTHFSFKAIHDNVLKLDILGKDDPTMMKNLQETTGVDIFTIPFDDKKILSLFTSPKELGVTKDQINCSTGTLGIPEFGTNFVINMLEETKPQTFSELVKISGLSHGTDVWQNNVQTIIQDKIVEFKDAIGCRDDVMTSLIEYGVEPSDAFKISEFVRKGKASSDPTKWQELVEIMHEANVDEWFIKVCGKIKYMFPKAHAIAYVMQGYRVAYFKLYYPLHYYANFFSMHSADFDLDCCLKGEKAIRNKINEIKLKGYAASVKEKGQLDTLIVALEMVCRGFSFQNIDLNKSDGMRFLVDTDNNSLIMPFSALEGLGENVATNIIRERKKQEFISIEDFQIRGKVNQTQIEKLRTLKVFGSLPESNQLSLF